jgi:hypothetical protein
MQDRRKAAITAYRERRKRQGVVPPLDGIDLDHRDDLERKVEL